MGGDHKANRAKCKRESFSFSNRATGCQNTAQYAIFSVLTAMETDTMEQLKEQLFTYRAYITAVYDGDTVTANIDLGMGVWKNKERLRLNRINAPEMRGERRAQGRISRDWLRSRILDEPVIIKTLHDKKGKYGRYLAEIWHDGKNINDLLVTKGLAEYKTY